jgi:hypothetical protein
VRPCHWTTASNGPIVHSPEYMRVESHGGMIFTGENQTTGRKACPGATLSSTNLTWTDLVENPGLRSDRPATNILSHGSAF